MKSGFVEAFIDGNDFTQRSHRVIRGTGVHKIGSVYTPPALAEWTATQLLRYVSENSVLRVLDPACGDGELLSSIVRIPDKPVEVIGRDIDSKAIAVASDRLKVPADFAVGDSLLPLSLASLEQKPDAIIANPPWERPDKNFRRQIQAAGYELAKGQFDLYDVFVERLIKSFPSTPMAFILPDSLFLPEHTGLRRFLLENAELLFLARLGEGLFPGIYRGTVVLVLRSSSSKSSNVECLRLQPKDRRDFLTKGLSLEMIRKAHSHMVSQKRFASNPNAEFTLDIRSDETAIAKMLDRDKYDWDKWLWIGRGIEIGKSGTTLRCEGCGEYRVLPKNGPGPNVKCFKCGMAFSVTSSIHQIVWRRKDSLEQNWSPMIVGEDVDRYTSEPRREVLINLPGIRYADSKLLRQPKLLIRKTGIGIRAAVDMSGALTIQTVYHFIPKDESLHPMLFYLAGVLNSKVMLAFHLRWSGESEWRSHPYVTPSTIKTLPVPTPFDNGFSMSDKASAIAALAQRRSEQEMVEREIEVLIEDMYGLTTSERQWVDEVIGSAQELRGISEMRSQLVINQDGVQK